MSTIRPAEQVNRKCYCMDPISALRAFGGVARSNALIRAGVSPDQLKQALDQQEVSRPMRGVYCLTEYDSDLYAATCAHAELACISAARRLGLWVFRNPSLIHASVNHGRGLDARFRVHRSEEPLTPLLICLQSARCLPELDALCIVESAVVLKHVALDPLRRAVKGQRDARLRTIVGLVDPHSQSIIETIARYHLRTAGFSTQSQVHVPGVGRLDLYIDGILGIEADGRKYHSDRREFEEDRRRWNLLTMRGVPVLRVTHALLTREPEHFLALVRAAVASHQPTKGQT
ncbi:very-short-patch-repair endonuclease [Arthrobacter sp. PL16]|nr:very-short-patch-repair endonuclease [Arthrobacter sp. PL16]